VIGDHAAGRGGQLRSPSAEPLRRRRSETPVHIDALLPYLIMVGSLMSPTPISRAEPKEVYEAILPLVPD
jgi:hypothetical protein